MNIFSQSKLNLKLKKSSDTLPTTSKNVVKKPAINDNLINNSVVSENDSFVEILHTTQPQEEKINMSQNIFKKLPSEQNVFNKTDLSVSNKINEIKHCPICLQMINIKNFTSHVKTCGVSHNLSSEVLMKAVDLQERQAAEREALGLPKLSKTQNEKKKSNKKTKLKIGSDSNLDLAIAMSVSLQESKEAEIIKEADTLLEAGLEKESLEKRKTLESFGFKSNQPIKSSLRVAKTNSLLFKQTKEDRDQRITEKVAMILIDSDSTDASPEELKNLNYCSSTKLKSKYLNNIRNVENELWKKSVLEEENVVEFYVKNLAKFIKPHKSSECIGFNTSQLSAFQITPEKDSSTNSKELNTALDNSDIKNSPYKVNAKNTMSEYSFKWKSIIGNQSMSDITIFVKDEIEIPAHSLVFFVQCPDILEDVITEISSNNKYKKMLMWLEYSYEACLAFLELIYSGQEPFVDLKFREDYLNLGKRYNMLMSLSDSEKNERGFEDKASKRKNSESYKSPTNFKRYKASSPDLFQSDDINENTCTSSPNFLGISVNDEKSLSALKIKQWLDHCRLSQQHHSSFTENLYTDVPSQIISPEKSPSRSFHSASTINVKASLSSNELTNIIDLKRGLENSDTNSIYQNDINSSPKPSVIDESNLKDVYPCNQRICNVPATSPTRISNLSRREPEVITINSSSDGESIDMVLSIDFKNARNKNNSLLSHSRFTNKKPNFSSNSSNHKNNLNIIELDDNSLDSIHSANTNELHHIKYKNDLLQYTDFSNLAVLGQANRLLINNDDEKSIFSDATNVLSINNLNTSKLSTDIKTTSSKLNSLTNTKEIKNNDECNDFLFLKSVCDPKLLNSWSTKKDFDENDSVFSRTTNILPRNLSTNLSKSKQDTKNNSKSILNVDDDYSSDSIRSISKPRLSKNTNSVELSIEQEILNSWSKKKDFDENDSVFSRTTNILPRNLSTNLSKSKQDTKNNSKSILNVDDDYSSDSICSISKPSLSKNKNSMELSIVEREILNSWSKKKDFDENDSVFSRATNILPRNLTTNLDSVNFVTKCATNNLIENSSLRKSQTQDSLLSGSDGGYSENISIKTTEIKDVNSVCSSHRDKCNIKPSCINYTKQNSTLSKCLNANSCIQINDVESNNTSSNTIFSDNNKVSSKRNLNSEILNDSLLKTSGRFSFENVTNFLHVNPEEVIDLTSSSPSKCISKCTSIESVSEDLVQPHQFNTTLNENEFQKDDSIFQQVIDDPWMDYNDGQTFNISYQNTSPVVSQGNIIVSKDESEMKTPKKDNNIHCIDSELQTPSSSTVLNNSIKINSQKKNSMTPNKYGSRINTPRSLRRVQSESVIGITEQVTPLPDYSAMKTPDLRKEFDRYGLKDLGKRKGKLMLRHIYDVLHPMVVSNEIDCNTENDQCSNSSDNSERGISDYESFDEPETLSQIDSSNKISVEVGFIQLLKENKDLHRNILCYNPIWIEELKEELKKYNVNISMQKLMVFLDDKCVTYRSRALNDQRQKTLAKKTTKRKKLF